MNDNLMYLRQQGKSLLWCDTCKKFIGPQRKKCQGHKIVAMQMLPVFK